MQDREALRRELMRIDGRGYKAYKDIRGVYDFGDFALHIDYVQGDPFAAPSRMRVRVSQGVAGYPEETYRNDSRRIGLCSYLAGQFGRAAHRMRERRGSGKSGLIEIDLPGQELLERTCVRVDGEKVEARFAVGLLAAGRRVLGRQAAQMLCDDLPVAVERSLRYGNDDPGMIRRYVEASEDADCARGMLEGRGLVAFVGEAAVLPRRSGVDERPLEGGEVVRFRPPEELRVELDLPNAGRVAGMGIPEGVTLIVGGGFHGKSTLLNGLERGVYNHRPGDGRERVVSHPATVKIRAEDGRRVAGVDISPFIRELPGGRQTRAFSSDNASGSTSQAANIVEGLEAGARVLLVDEDTAATNFMIRDQRMQRLIAAENEPITPLIDRVRPLYDELGVSTVLVVGGSGDYFDVADRVIAMESYVPREVTKEAKVIAAELRTERVREGDGSFGRVAARSPLPRSIDPSRGRREVNVKARGLRTVLFGEETIDLGGVEQLVDASQTRALSAALLYAREKYIDGKRSLSQVLDRVMADIEREGLDVLDRRAVGDHALFRRFELAAALNRLRSLEVAQLG